MALGPKRPRRHKAMSQLSRAGAGEHCGPGSQGSLHTAQNLPSRKRHEVTKREQFRRGTPDTYTGPQALGPAGKRELSS